MTLIIDPMHGLPTEVSDTIVLAPGVFSLTVGTGAFAVANRTAAFVFNDTETGIIATLFRMPNYWRTFHVDFIWTSNNATGNIAWRCDVGSMPAAGAPAPDAAAGVLTVGSLATINNLAVTRVKTSAAATRGASIMEVIRIGGDASDTLAGFGHFLGAVATRAS